MDFIKMFNVIDTDSSGSITVSDLEKFMKEHNFTDDFVDIWLSIFDQNHKGVITIDDFCDILGLEIDEEMILLLHKKRKLSTLNLDEFISIDDNMDQSVVHVSADKPIATTPRKVVSNFIRRLSRTNLLDHSDSDITQSTDSIFNFDQTDLANKSDKPISLANIISSIIKKQNTSESFLDKFKLKNNKSPSITSNSSPNEVKTKPSFLKRLFSSNSTEKSQKRSSTDSSILNDSSNDETDSIKSLQIAEMKEILENNKTKQKSLNEPAEDSDIDYIDIVPKNIQNSYKIPHANNDETDKSQSKSKSKISDIVSKFDKPHQEHTPNERHMNQNIHKELTDLQNKRIKNDNTKDLKPTKLNDIVIKDNRKKYNATDDILRKSSLKYSDSNKFKKRVSFIEEIDINNINNKNDNSTSIEDNKSNSSHKSPNFKLLIKDTRRNKEVELIKNSNSPFNKPLILDQYGNFNNNKLCRDKIFSNVSENDENDIIEIEINDKSYKSNDDLFDDLNDSDIKLLNNDTFKQSFESYYDINKSIKDNLLNLLSKLNTDYLLDLAQQLKYYLDKNYGRAWHVIIVNGKCFIDGSCQEGSNINFEYDDLTFNVWKT